MRLPIALVALLALTACGVDGPPQPPAAKPASKSGFSISGDARVGVVGKL